MLYRTDKNQTQKMKDQERSVTNPTALLLRAFTKFLQKKEEQQGSLRNTVNSIQNTKYKCMSILIIKDILCYAIKKKSDGSSEGWNQSIEINVQDYNKS